MNSREEPVLEAEEKELARCIAFNGNHRIALGTLREVALKTKRAMDKDKDSSVLIFDARTSEVIELDFRGTLAELETRLGEKSQVPPEPAEKRGPGRPKLGVIGREVTLLPRHWDWLDEQPGGASVALRKLVEAAKRENREKDEARRSQQSVHRFMHAMAGNLPGFEEASRAFYTGKQEVFEILIKSWPGDVRDHLQTLVAAALRDEATAVAKGTLQATSNNL